jgi:predicted glycosyltransferase
VKIWIDLSNSPHPLLFAPVARRLECEGHSVLVTARDNAQTVELARERWPEVEVIGRESPRSRATKLATIGRRVSKLRGWAAANRPDVALSHNSYAQIVAAAGLRIPAVTAMDFEHQPANHLAFRLAKTVLIPDVLPVRALQWQGASARKLLRYPGLKEELYIGDFCPDAAILTKIGLTMRPRTVAIVRTAPTRALYHSSTNPLVAGALRAICGQEGVVCVVLTRHPEQRAVIDAMQLPNCIVPRTAVDSRSLMYVADVMIGAGGTMTREAALMGVRTWSLFAGPAPAVDQWLERRGLLKRLTNPSQLSRLAPRTAEPPSHVALRQRGAAIERVFVDATLSAAERPRHNRACA